MATLIQILFFVSILGVQTPEFLVFEHVGEQDRPVTGLIIIESEETYIKRKGRFEEHGISVNDFQVLKWFVLNEKLYRSRKCNDVGGVYGSFTIQLFVKDDFRCFYIDKPEESIDFFYKLFFKAKFHGMSQELQNSIEELVVQIMGIDAYRKKYNPLYKVQQK